MKELYCQIKPYIQPFEKKLAIRELKALCEIFPDSDSGGLDSSIIRVRSPKSSGYLASKLAYCEYIFDRKPIRTLQVLKEATVNVVRNGIPLPEIFSRLPFVGEVPLPNRRCLRYGPHGIHEYKGKFFPQLVISLLNISKAHGGAIVADPMCGSGTTLVEAVLSGHRAVGVDRNPLSVFMTRTKCSLLQVEPGELSRTYERVRRRVLEVSSRERNASLDYFRELISDDQSYLEKWFSKSVLEDLDKIAITVNKEKKGPCKDLLWMSLSNIIRKVSWQKNDDLRVRKKDELDSDVDPVREFLEDFGRSTRLILALRLQMGSHKFGSFEVKEGDSKKLSEIWPRLMGKVDVIITSPPYATALPYIDTDRLSLIYLRLLRRRDHRAYDQSMIGNREITEKTRRSLLECFREQKHILPGSIVQLIEHIEELNNGSDVGFRRRNLPAILAKYFFDMRQVLSGMTRMLRPDGRAYVVVGDNHTIAGGQRVDIKTGELLVCLAESVGLICQENLPMEMLVSREIFRKNAVASENILCFRRSYM